VNRNSPAPSSEAMPPIRAWLRWMNERTRALLEYHFEHDPQRGFVIAASGEAADVVIVDHDFPGARAAIDSGKWRDGPPLIVLAHGELTLDDALVLTKPVDRSSLDAAAVRLRDAAHDARPAAGPGSRTETPPSSTPSAPATAAPSAPVAEPPLLELGDRRSAVLPDLTAVASAPRDERARARVDALCGPPRTLDELADPDDPVHRYDPARHLSGRLTDALDTLAAGKGEILGLTLTLPGVELYVLPWLDRVCTSEPLTWHVGVDRAFRPLEDGDGDVVTYPAGTINELVGRVNADACQAYPTAAFRWLAALFSARGRLPLSADVERAFRLARWPNLSRLEMTPECMRIVADWTANPRSVADMIRHLGCEPRYVTALHAATTAAGLLHPADPTDPGEDDGA